MLSRWTCKVLGLSKRAFAASTAQTWKNLDFYYKYDYTNKMAWIDHKVRFPLFRVIDLEGKLLAPQYDTFTKDELFSIVDQMIKSRQMDIVYNNAQRQNRISFYMQGILEEAANLGCVTAIKPTDGLFLQYREFPMIMNRGISRLQILHNLKGNKEDVTFGKCFPLMHADPKYNVFPTSAPLGNRNPHAAGAGFYFRTQNQDRVAVCVFGEGSASEGDFHASMNFAATLGSQTLFFCRNNVYAISTFRDDQYAGDGIAPRGIGYGVPAIKVDGHDYLAVHHAVKEARKMIMERKGPVLVEAYTYRAGDHSTSDSAASYRTKTKMVEVQKYMDSLGDPLTRLTKFMKHKGWLPNPEEHITKLSEKAKAECLEYLKTIDVVPMAHHEVMFEGVYNEEPWNIKEQKEELTKHLEKFGELYPMKEFPKA